MAGLNLGGRTSVTFVTPTNPPSATGQSATSLAFGGAQVASGGQAGDTAAIGGTALGVASLVLLVLIWKSLPR